MNLMVSVGVSFMVPSMTRIAPFCTLSSFSIFVSDSEAYSAVNDTEYHALIQSEEVALFNTLCSTERKGGSNDSPEIPDRRETSYIPSLPSGEKEDEEEKRASISL